jgi:hypothetical protein
VNCHVLHSLRLPMIARLAKGVCVGQGLERPVDENPTFQELA